MRIELQQIEQIERFLSGTMSAEESAKFQAEINASPELTLQLEHFSILKQAVVRNALKADIQRYAPKNKFAFKKWASILAGVIVLIGTLYGLLNFNSAQNESSETISKVQSTNHAELSEPVNDSSIVNSSQMLPSDYLRPPKKVFSNPRAVRENGAENQLIFWIEPEIQRFEISLSTGKAIECANGTLIIVPADAFLDDNGFVIQNSVQLEVIEATRLSDMIAYNLTTLSNGKPLSSGGMLFIQPYSDGKKVNINPQRPLYIEIPTDDYNPNMQSWRGVVDDKGDISWEDPRDLEKFLVRVDFDLLDFLPPGFEDAVHAGMPFRKHKTASKDLVDSLYYALNNPYGSNDDQEFDCSKNDLQYLFGDLGYIVDKGYEELGMSKSRYDKYKAEYDKEVEKLIKKINSGAELSLYEEKSKCLLIQKGMLTETRTGNRAVKRKNLTTSKVSISTSQSSVIPPINEGKNDVSPKYEEVLTNNNVLCYINPLTIKTLRTELFANTFIATREFESRLRVLHGIPNADPLLDLYIKNLDKNLWEVDLMVAQKLTGNNKKVFEDFAKQKLTNLRDAEIYQDLLNEYYEQKLQDFQKENELLHNAYLKKNSQELQAIRNEINVFKAKISQIENEQATLKSRMDLGYINPSGTLGLNQVQDSLPRPSVVSSQNVYATQWFEPGWMNIDVYLKSLNNGSVDVNVLVNNPRKDIEHIKIYQCINPLKTIVPLNLNLGKVLARFPAANHSEAVRSKAACVIGIQWTKNGDLLFADLQFNPYKVGLLELSWERISSDELHKRLRVLNNTKDLIKHVKKQEDIIVKVQANYQEHNRLEKRIQAAETKFNELQIQFDKEREFMTYLAEKISVCEVVPLAEPSVTIPANPNVTVEQVEQQPIFRNGEQAMMLFIKENFKFPANVPDLPKNGTIYVSVLVLADGRVTDVSIRQGLHPLLDAEALRVVNAFPNFSPAILNGAAVNCRMVIPIKIRKD